MRPPGPLEIGLILLLLTPLVVIGLILLNRGKRGRATQIKGGEVGEMQAIDTIYEPTVDLRNLSEEQRKAFGQHKFTSTFPTPLVILLHFITLGIFTLVYFGLKHSKLPMIKHDDFGAGEAIGFMFIPFFNLYWQFRFWLRLVDRVNFQLRLRGSPPTISKGLMLATIIVSFIPYVGFASILIMYPICIGEIQIATNKLAKEHPWPS